MQHVGRSDPLDQRLALTESARQEQRRKVVLVQTLDGGRVLMIRALHANREGVMMKRGPLVPRLPPGRIHL